MKPNLSLGHLALVMNTPKPPPRQKIKRRTATVAPLVTETIPNYYSPSSDSFSQHFSAYKSIIKPEIVIQSEPNEEQININNLQCKRTSLNRIYGLRSFKERKCSLPTVIEDPVIESAIKESKFSSKILKADDQPKIGQNKKV